MTTEVFNSSLFSANQSGEELLIKLGDFDVTPDAIKDIAVQHSVPQALFGFQKKSPISFIEPILRTLPTMTAVVEENSVIAFVHPNKKFVTDEQFSEVKQAIAQYDPEEFSLMGTDHWNYRIGAVRPLQGGIQLDTALMRLACLNGARVQHSAYQRAFSAMPSLKEISEFKPISPEEFLIQVFGVDNARIASVADLERMANVSTVEDVDLYFPLQKIEDHYLKNAGVDLSKISSKSKSYLSSGLSYFDAFNILSYVTTHHAEPSFNTQKNVGTFLSKSQLNSYEIMKLSQNNLTAPTFDTESLKRLRGDANLN